MFWFLFHKATELSREKRKILSCTIGCCSTRPHSAERNVKYNRVELLKKHKISKEIEKGESCTAAFLNKRGENVVLEAYDTDDLLSGSL